MQPSIRSAKETRERRIFNHQERCQWIIYYAQKKAPRWPPPRGVGVKYRRLRRMERFGANKKEKERKKIIDQSRGSQ